MRGEFNKTFTARYGSRSETGPPGAIFATDIPCRRVLQNQIENDQFPFTLTDEWITNDEIELTGPKVTSPWLGALFTDHFVADEVTLSNEPGVWYSVCRKEEVLPFGRPLYWRYLLLPLASVVVPPWLPLTPLPPPPPPSPPVAVLPGNMCQFPGEIASPGTYLVRGYGVFVEGLYHVVLPGGGPYRFSVPTGPAGDWYVDVRSVPGGGGCCGSGESPLSITSEGPECVSFPAIVGATTSTFCLEILQVNGFSIPDFFQLKIEAGVCP